MRPRYKRGALWDLVDLFDIVIPRQRYPGTQRERLSFYRSVTVTQFKLCFDVQQSEHSFVADRSDINLVDDGNNVNAMSVRR